MADRKFAGTPADFAVATGALADIVDESGTPVDDGEGGTLQGWAALLPNLAAEFDVYDVDSNAYTDLLDHTGAPVSTVSSSAVYATAAQLLMFTVQGLPDEVGDVYLVGSGGTPFSGPTYRMTPLSDEIFARLAALESSVTGLELDDLINVDAEDKTNGDSLFWNNSTGQWEPGSAAGTGTVTSINDEEPDGSGNVELSASDVGAASAADMAVLKLRGYIGLAYTGSGYEPKPSGFTLAIRPGPQEPQSNLAVGDIWLQPEQS